MPKTKEYSMREIIIDQCLGSGQEYTREELQEEVNRQLESRDMLPIRSRTTILQDLQEMNEKFYKMYGRYGIVSENRNRRRYYRYRNDVQSIYNRELTAEEIGKLQEVRRLLQGFKVLPHFDWLDEMSARLDQNIISGQRDIASFESGTTKDARFFLPLFNAIANRQVVTIDYQRFGMEPKQRILHPYYLKQYRLRWYLLARIDQKEGVCVFALDRILSLSINNQVAYMDAGMSFAHYFDDIVGVSHPDGGKVEHVTLWVDSWLENYLRTSPIHISQKLESMGDDGCRVSLDVIVNYELEQELIFYAEHLSVLSPSHLQERLITRIRKQLEGYEKEVK